MLCPHCGTDVGKEVSLCPRCFTEQSRAEHAALTGSRSSAARWRTWYPAGFWLRVVALLIDVAVVLFVERLISFTISKPLFGEVFHNLVKALSDTGAASSTGEGQSITFYLGALLTLVLVPALLFLSIGWLYFALFEASRFRATIGKLIVGICVTDVSGHKISFARATVRHLGKFVSVLTLGFGFVLTAFTGRKCSLHDILSGCLVTKTDSFSPGRLFIVVPATVIITFATFAPAPPGEKKKGFFHRVSDAVVGTETEDVFARHDWQATTSARGVLHGRPFVPEQVTLKKGVLTFRQFDPVNGETKLSINTFRQMSRMQGASVNFKTGEKKKGLIPHIHKVWREGKNEASQTKIYTRKEGYELELKFEYIASGDQLPGTINLHLPDGKGSYLTGQFRATVQE